MDQKQQVTALIKRFYGDKSKRIHYLTSNSMPNVMGTAPDFQNELNQIKTGGYHPIKSLEFDSRRFGSSNIGYPKDAVNNAKRDVHDLKRSRTAQNSSATRRYVQQDLVSIKKNQDLPSNELVLISNANDSQVIRSVKPVDVEFIYHNTHIPDRIALARHPKVMYYTIRDAKIDLKADLN